MLFKHFTDKCFRATFGDWIWKTEPLAFIVHQCHILMMAGSRQLYSSSVCCNIKLISTCWKKKRVGKNLFFSSQGSKSDWEEDAKYSTNLMCKYCELYSDMQQCSGEKWKPKTLDCSQKVAWYEQLRLGLGLGPTLKVVGYEQRSKQEWEDKLLLNKMKP